MGGRAQGVLSTACIVYSGYYAKYDLGHEVGHCLGLFHTHHGTSKDERGKGTIPELVNGSNSAYAGDLIVDTPADPNTWSAIDGSFVNREKDANGESYRPDPTNIMCYSSDAQRFTPMQAQKMLTALNSSSQLKNIIVHREIPNKHLRAGDTIFVKDLLPTDQIQWIYSKGLNNYCYDQIDAISNDRYIVTPAEDSQFLDLKANITTAEGKTIELTGKATSGAPNLDLGMIVWEAESETNEDLGIYGETQEGKCGTSYEDGMCYWSDINIYGGTTLNLRYYDLACGPIPCTFKCVTSTNRVIEDIRFIITPADCANGYLEFYVKDKYGQIDESRVFQIFTNVHGRYYAAQVKDGSITFEGRLGKSLKKSASAPLISKIEIYNKAGKLILNEARQKVSVAALSLTPLAKGEYKAIVSDNDFSQEILFEI